MLCRYHRCYYELPNIIIRLARCISTRLVEGNISTHSTEHCLQPPHVSNLSLRVIR